MGWHKIPEFDSVSSSDDNSFVGSRVQPTGKISVKLPVDWLCRQMEKFNLTITEGYPSRNTEIARPLRDQFVKPPRSSRWYDMHADKKDSDLSTVCSWSLEPAKLNSAFSRVARHSLPAAPTSRPLSQDILRRWERAAREQTVMCNQAAGLSRCLTTVQDAMSTQLKNLHLGKSKGKSFERTQQAVDELVYLVTFNRSISQAMARTMQDLSERVFISVANFTLLVKTATWNIFMLVRNKTRSLHCALLPSICSHYSLTSFSLKLRKRCPEVSRGVLLASRTGNLVVSIHILPMTSRLIKRTGSHLSQLGSKYANANRERKVVVSLQPS